MASRFESEPHEPSGAFAHLPERHRAPPQSESEPQNPPAAVAHLPPRQVTPRPQSECEPQELPTHTALGRKKYPGSSTDRKIVRRFISSVSRKELLEINFCATSTSRSDAHGEWLTTARSASEEAMSEKLVGW